VFGVKAKSLDLATLELFLVKGIGNQLEIEIFGFGEISLVYEKNR
jgi:hypothetical protein